MRPDNPTMPLLDLDSGVPVKAQIQIAMAATDKWLADAERKLVGRQIVRTHDDDPLYGAICTITDVAIAAGASGNHLFVTAPAREVEAEEREAAPRGRGHSYRVRASRMPLEIGVTCALLLQDDTPTKGTK